MINEFTNIIIEAYTNKAEYPALLQEELKDNADDDDMMKLFNLYDYTGNNEDDFVSNDDLRETIKDCNIPFSLKKCKLLLKTKGVLEGKNKKGDKRGLTGLKDKE